MPDLRPEDIPEYHKALKLVASWYLQRFPLPVTDIALAFLDARHAGYIEAYEEMIARRERFCSMTAGDLQEIIRTLKSVPPSLPIDGRP